MTGRKPEQEGAKEIALDIGHAYAGDMYEKSPKYDELLGHYTHMAEHGYDTRRGKHVQNTYDTQEAVKFRGELRQLFRAHKIRSVLDYGAGNSPWDQKKVREGGTLLDFTTATSYHAFEPSRSVDQRQTCDAAVSFDVMEHIFLADVGFVLDQIMQHARKLVVINVACYPANALLPTGENAHITVRPPQWWKGAVDMGACRYPELTVALFCSPTYNEVVKFPPIRFADVIREKGYSR